MGQKFTSRVSYVFVVVFVGAIIISFVFTGLGSGRVGKRGGQAAVGSVGGNPIGADEYQRELQQRLNYFSNIMGGRSLTSKEIESYGIKKMVLQSIISKKLMINFAQ